MHTNSRVHMAARTVSHLHILQQGCDVCHKGHGLQGNPELLALLAKLVSPRHNTRTLLQVTRTHLEKIARGWKVGWQ